MRYDMRNEVTEPLYCFVHLPNDPMLMHAKVAGLPAASDAMLARGNEP
jgi:hypothetical protein